MDADSNEEGKMDATNCSGDDDNDDDSPFDRLPPELATMIFKHLDLRERMNARLVARRWNEMILNSVQLKLRIHADCSRTKGDWLEGNWIVTDIPATTKADFIQRSSKRSIQPLMETPGTTLNEQIKQLPEALMNRVFDIELRLAKGCAPTLEILDDIERIVSRPTKLHLNLASARLPQSMFASSAMAVATFAEKFPTFQLHSLSAIVKFPAKNDFRANYFRMDTLSNAGQNVNLKLMRCGRSSGELRFVVERFPQLTKLHMEFGKRDVVDEENRFRAAPNWQRLSQLERLQHLTIKGNRIAPYAPNLSQQFRLPELCTLRLINVKLPTNGTFFQGTPKLNSLMYRSRCEPENNGGHSATTDIQAIASAMRNGHLKQLTDITINLCTNDIGTSLECLQLMCKAASQSGSACSKFQHLTWAGPVPVATSEPDAPSLRKALFDLPARILAQRPFVLEMQRCDGVSANAEEFNELLNALCAAVQQSGLKRLRLSEVRFNEAITATTLCDLIKASHPLSSTIDDDDDDDDSVLRIIWTHPTIQGYDQQIDMKVMPAISPPTPPPPPFV